jgi:carbon-monoxide dehydrogenase medium subunit
MKPPPFSYHDPRTVSDVVGLLGRLDNAKLLAGGQSLMPMLNMRYVQPDHVIDLNLVEGLSFIREKNGALEIGAMTRQRELEFSEIVKRRCPLMHEAIQLIGHRQTRNRGTIGGSLCHLDPSREIEFSAFPVAYMTPALELNELLSAIRLPLWPEGHGYGFVEFARRHGDFAIVSAAALITEDAGGKITRASVTLGGMGTAPIRAREVEEALIGQAPEDALLREACEACRNFEAIDDVHAPASYRQHLATVMSRRALERARGRLPSRAKTH